MLVVQCPVRQWQMKCNAVMGLTRTLTCCARAYEARLQELYTDDQVDDIW